MDEIMATNLFAFCVISAVAIKTNTLTSLGFCFFYFVYIVSDFLYLSFGMHPTLMYLVNAINSAIVMIYFLFCALYKPEICRTWFLCALFVFLCYVIPNAQISGLVDSNVYYLSTEMYANLMKFNWVADILLVFIGSYKERCCECDREFSL